MVAPPVRASRQTVDYALSATRPLAALLALVAASHDSAAEKVCLAAYFCLAIGALTLRNASRRFDAGRLSAPMQSLDIAAAAAAAAFAGRADWPFLILVVYALSAAAARWRAATTTLAAEVAKVAAFTTSVDVRHGLKATMQAAFTCMCQVFGAGRVVLIVWNVKTESLIAWTGVADASGAVHDVQWQTLDPGDASACGIEPYAAVYFVRPRVEGGTLDATAIDTEGGAVRNAGGTIAAPLAAALGPFDRLLAVRVGVGDAASAAHLFLVNVAVEDRVKALRSALRVVGQIAPAVRNVYALSRVRSAAAAVARGRIAREVHDGVVQGVLGVEMHVAALIRRFAGESPAVTGELARLREVLRQEAVGLRDLMQHMRTAEVNGAELVDVLTDSVQRFQRETGINARLITQLDRVPLGPNACREVTRILNEALINVRRHSGASNVFVRLSTVNGDCCLSIEDNGRGFLFAGRRTQQDLDASRQAPFVINERVRSLGGTLTLESEPGRGARVEVAIPVAGHRVYA